MKTRKPDPKTCTEAAERIYRKYEGSYTPDAKEMREVSFVLKAFGETPVPQPVLSRYEWANI